ncbi:MAG: dienelactone hydrolase family protein [Chloroflexota bacterium]|nr:dienelactone hydrolase family protein [Chloroflexota bacterium]
MPGEMIEFPSNGRQTPGYLAVPSGRRGPGVVVIQEWWGLVGHIKDVADRFAAEGFVALAPDLYHGKTTTEPDEAGKLMMSLQMDKAARDLSGAVEYLRGHAAVDPKRVGSVGYCLGGGLSLYLATVAPVDACVIYYGVLPGVQPDLSRLQCPVLGHYAEHDDFASPEAARALEEQIHGQGRPVEFHIYPGTTHAFFNDDRAEVYDEAAARQSWERTLAFFRQHLG